MARPGTAAWFKQQEEARAAGGMAGAGSRRASYIAGAGSQDSSDLPPPQATVWRRPFEGNPTVNRMKGGTRPRGGIYPDYESAMNYVNRNANLANSQAWLMRETSQGDIELYIAEDTQTTR